MRIIVLRRPDVNGKPGEIECQLSNKLDEFPGFGDVAYANNLDGVGEGSVFGRILTTVIENGKIILSATVGDMDFENVVNAGDLYAMSRTAGVSSLYLGATYMGYYNGAAWRAYIKGDGSFKFYIGASDYIEGAGGVVTVRGTLNASDINAGTLTASYISGGTLNFAAISRSSLTILKNEIGNGQVQTAYAHIDMTGASLDFKAQDAYNISGLRGYTGTSSYWIDLRNNTWYGYNTSSYLNLGSDVALRANGDLTLDAQGGDLYFRKGSTSNRIYFYDMQIYSGKSLTNYYMPINVNGTDYYLRLNN